MLCAYQAIKIKLTIEKVINIIKAHCISNNVVLLLAYSFQYA